MINHIRCFGYLKFVSLVELKIEENIPLVEVTLELPYFSISCLLSLVHIHSVFFIRKKTQTIQENKNNNKKSCWFHNVYFFFFFFLGGPWSESLLLPESELSEDEDEDEEEDEEEEELSSSLSLLLSLSSEEELEESLLSDDESLEEPPEPLLLSLESLAFFFTFFSLEPSVPGPAMLRGLFSFSLSFFFISVVLDGLCTYFLFPVHS